MHNDRFKKCHRDENKTNNQYCSDNANKIFRQHRSAQLWNFLFIHLKIYHFQRKITQGISQSQFENNDSLCKTFHMKKSLICVCAKLIMTERDTYESGTVNVFYLQRRLIHSENVKLLKVILL